MSEDLFYVQDKRGYVGNDLLFWAEAGGYTCDISKAEVFTREKAIELNSHRETDIPWPKSYIDSKVRPVIDAQNVNVKDALSGTGIKLFKPKPPKKPVYRCVGCGQFKSERQYYSMRCTNCDSTNEH